MRAGKTLKDYWKRMVASRFGAIATSRDLVLEEMDFERDVDDILNLMRIEEWPFTRADLEVSHKQPKATAFVARKKGQFAGFFMTHHFGDIGYLDMMIIDEKFRRKRIAGPLYFKTVRALKKKGISSLVVHTTNDSAAMIQLLGFKKGQTFTLLAKDPPEQFSNCVSDSCCLLTIDDLDEIVALDEAVFGENREGWIRVLLQQPTTRFLGIRKAGRLVASVCLRERSEGAICLDAVNSLDKSLIKEILVQALDACQGLRVECFVRDQSELAANLVEAGFEIPDFFTEIGPLREWTRGPCNGVGQSKHVQCLSWF